MPDIPILPDRVAVAPAAPQSESWADFPPVGMMDETAKANAWGRMSLLAQEARQVSQPFITIADISTTVFNWGDVEWDGQGYNPPSDIDRFQANQVRNDTEAANKATFREPLGFEVVFAETGSSAPQFWAGPIDLGESLGIPPEMLGNLGGATQQPMPWMLVQQVRQALAQQQLPDEFIISADKRTLGAIYQAYFDGAWDDPKLNGNHWASRFGLDAGTQGWTWALYDWRGPAGDALRSVSIKQVFPDTQQVRVEDMQHILVDFVFDKTWAKQAFPEIAADIEANKQAGGSIPVQVDGNTQFGQRDNKLFQRDIVVMRIGWFRDQPMPLSAEEAINGGQVQQGAMGSDPLGTGLGGSGEAGPTNPTDTPVQPTGATNQYSLPDGTPITPPLPGKPIDPAWPVKTVLRRIVAIAGKVVWDGPEEHWDIPIIHLVNEPITNTPFGIGTPFKCWQVQRARVGAYDDVRRHIAFYAAPFTAMPTDVYDALGFAPGDAYIRPGQVAKINPEYFINQNRKIGDLLMQVPPPQMPPALPQAIQMLETLQTQLSNNVPVLRGDDEQLGAGASGKKVMALQEAAVQQVNNGDEVESCFRRLGTLIHYAHVRFATPEQVYEHYRKLPYSVIEAIHTTIAPNVPSSVRVTAATGAGAMLQKRRSDALTFNQTIDQFTGKPMLDQESAREACDIDNEEVEERLKVQALQKGQQGQQPPSEAISFKDLPPGGQMQMAAQAGIHLDPNELLQIQQQEHEQAMAKANNAGKNGSSNGNGRFGNG